MKKRQSNKTQMRQLKGSEKRLNELEGIEERKK